MADNSEPQAVGFLVIKRARLAPSSIGGSIMNRELVSHNRPIFDQLHPAVYKAAVGLVAWFALAAWILFDRQNDIGLPLALISVLLLVAVFLPWSLSLDRQKHQLADQKHLEQIA